MVRQVGRTVVREVARGLLGVLGFGLLAAWAAAAAPGNVLACVEIQVVEVGGAVVHVGFTDRGIGHTEQPHRWLLSMTDQTGAAKCRAQALGPQNMG